MAKAATSSELIGEEEKVRRWRREEFVRMGCTTGDAEKLADSDADLNRARAMVADGCEPDLLLGILT